MITKEAIEIVGDAALKYGIKNIKISESERPSLILDITFSERPAQILMQTPTIPIGTAGVPTDDQFLFMSSGIPMTDDEINARTPA